MPLPVEVVVTFTSLGAAAAGYAFREYRNRVRPFFQIIGIRGEIRKNSDKVKVPGEIVKALSSTFHPGSLEENTALGEVYNCWDRADDLERFWPDTRAEIQRVLESKSDADFLNHLASAFGGTYFDRWAMRLLLNDRLAFPEVSKPPPVQELVHVHLDPQEKYVWLVFPSKTVSFGARMDLEVIRAKCAPLLQAVQHLDRDLITAVLGQYVKQFDDDYRASMSCITKLKQIIDEHCRWTFVCYLANLSNAPIMVERSASLTVADPTTALDPQPCYLALLTKTQEEFGQLADTRVPLIIRPSGSENFCFITDRVQKDMKQGAALREVFKRGEAKCRLEVRVRKVGLLNRQKYWSADTLFVESKDLKTE